MTLYYTRGLMMKPHLAWGQEIGDLVARAGAKIERENIPMYPRSLYNDRSRYNASAIIQVALLHLAKGAAALPRRKWAGWVVSFNAMQKTQDIGLTLDTDSLTVIAQVGEILEQWNWKPHKFFIVSRRHPKAYRKLPIIVFALLFFLESESQ